MQTFLISLIAWDTFRSYTICLVLEYVRWLKPKNSPAQLGVVLLSRQRQIKGALNCLKGDLEAAQADAFPEGS